MCELYPRLYSCCGIPVRIALVFIAILSIVTGALMNAVLKKAGVNIASIQDVRNFNNITKDMFGSSPAPGPQFGPGGGGGPSNPWGPGAPGGPGAPYVRAEDAEVENTTKSLDDEVDEDVKLPTIEIVGDDAEGITEVKAANVTSLGPIQNVMTATASSDPASTLSVVRFNYDTDEDSSEKTGHGHNSTKGKHKNTTTTTTATTTTTVMLITTKTWDQRESNQEPMVRAMGMLNRNGLNFMAILFIALGILLFVANFMNSPDLMLLYVVLCIANCVAGLLLLFSVVAECAKAREVCLLNRLDWFSSMGVLIIWFFYVFAWAFFASVANGFANDATGNELP